MAGVSATDMEAACANWFELPTTKVSNVKRGLSGMPWLTVPGGAGLSAAVRALAAMSDGATARVPSDSG